MGCPGLWRRLLQAAAAKELHQQNHLMILVPGPRPDILRAQAASGGTQDTGAETPGDELQFVGG
jgi:hypothetical protein